MLQINAGEIEKNCALVVISFRNALQFGEYAVLLQHILKLNIMRPRHFIPLSLAALACACTGRDGGDGGQQGLSSGKDSLSWGTASVRIEEPIAQGEDLCYHIELNLDTLPAGSALAEGLAAMLRDSVLSVQGYASLQESATAFGSETEASWKESIAELYEPETGDDYTLQYEYTLEGRAVETGRDDVVSYMVTTDQYTGGAHGMYSVQYFNFDKESGTLIHIRDIVPAKEERRVIKAMEKQLCKDWDASDLTDLQEKTGITVLGDLYLTNNFLMKKDSIEFLFNQYEIAPYSAGLIEVTVKAPDSPRVFF